MARGSGLCLVAGAEGALGREALLGLAAEHYVVVGSCRTEKDKAQLDAFLGGQGVVGIQTVVADLSDEDSVHKMVHHVEARFGPIAYLLNAAGGFHWATVQQAAISDFDFLISANLKSSWLLTKALLPRMIHRNFGRMVFISSRTTQGLGEPGMGLYMASKAALNALVQCTAQEVKTYNINVNALLPTIIDTEPNRLAMPDRDHTAWVEPRSLVTLAHMMFSEAGSQINGALLPVTGRI